MIEERSKAAKSRMRVLKFYLRISSRAFIFEFRPEILFRKESPSVHVIPFLNQNGNANTPRGGTRAREQRRDSTCSTERSRTAKPIQFNPPLRGTKLTFDLELESDD